MVDGASESFFNYVLEISYDGGHFAGWQSQVDGSGVQDSIERALLELGEKSPGAKKTGKGRVNGAGRTDAGVHARAQIASVHLSRSWEPRRLTLALNSKLPDAVSVMRTALVPPAFHARRSAISREYRYFIWNSPTCFPHIRPYVLWQPGKHFNWGRAADAARILEGTHDFRAFCRKADAPEKTLRTVARSRIYARGKLILYRVVANGFLTNMVRIMAGNLMDVARGRSDESKIASLLRGADRSEGADTPLPSGLFLWRVNYPETIDWE
jgi:tRNA pseudouridine38-40 synthase